MTNKRDKVIDVYHRIMARARDEASYSKDKTNTREERKESDKASRLLYWTASLLENTEEVNPTA